MPVYIGKSGDLVRCYWCLTHRQTTEDRATQLVESIKFKLSHAIVYFVRKLRPCASSPRLDLKCVLFWVFVCVCTIIYLVCVFVFVFWLLCFVQVEADYGGAHPLLATTWPTGWRNFQPAQGKSPTQENTIRKHDTNRKSQTKENTPRKPDTNTTNGVTCTQPVNNITGILHNVQCRTLGLNHSDY